MKACGVPLFYSDLKLRSCLIGINLKRSIRPPYDAGFIRLCCVRHECRAPAKLERHIPLMGKKRNLVGWAAAADDDFSFLVGSAYSAFALGEIVPVRD